MRMYNVNVKDGLSNFAKSFLSNLRAILFAFVIAVVIWLTVSFQVFPTVGETIEVPITAELTAYMQDVRLELAGNFDETITVPIEGKRYEISQLKADDFFAYLDFSEVKEPGDHDVKVVVQPRDEVNAEFLVSGDIYKTVKIIQIVEKTLQTTADAQNVTVGGGMTIDFANIVISPESVTVSGEKSLIDSIQDARVIVAGGEPLFATTVLHDGELTFLDNKGEVVIADGIYTEDRAFSVTIPVFKRKTLPLEVIINAPENFDLASFYEKISIEPADLTIASPDPSIDNHNVWTLDAISLSDITFAYLETGYPVKITLPEGYMNISGDNEVEIVFEGMNDYNVRTFQVPSSNFTNINVPAGYKVEHVTRVIPVKVVGPSDVINSMTASDIKGTINFAGVTDISPGEWSIGVKFTIDGTNVSAWVIDEYKIDIELTAG